MNVGTFQSRDLMRARRWAFLVGVNHYQDSGIRDLRCCANDARALFELLISGRENGYTEERSRLLTSDNDAYPTTRLEILRSLDEMARKTEAEDLLLFYFSGHGEVIDGEAYLLPTDATIGRLLIDTAIPLTRIKELMQTAAARTKAIIIDACHAGVHLGRRSTAEDNEQFIQSVLEQSEGIAILAASSQDELSWEDPRIGHGVFTYYLLEALTGAVDPFMERYITLNAVAAYVQQKVLTWAADNNVRQRSTLEFQGVGEIVLLTMSNPAINTPVTIENAHAMARSESPISRTFPIAVRRSEDFYNRGQELSRISRILSSTAEKPIVIRGERAIGKTSFLHRVKKLLEDEHWPGRNFLHFSIEPSSTPTCVHFAQELWHGLLHCLQETHIQLPAAITAPFEFSTFSRFEHHLRSLQTLAPTTTFVVFMDEFTRPRSGSDMPTDQHSELEFRRILGLIKYIVEVTDFPLVFIISLLEDLPSGYSSPLHTAEPIILHPFNRKDFDQFTRDLLRGFDIDDKGLDWLYRYTGGHPYFCKLMLTKLFDLMDLNGEQSVSIERLQDAAQAAKSSAHADVIRDIYVHHLTEPQRYVFLWLATRKDIVTSQDIDCADTEIKTAIRQLIRRDFIVRQDDGSCRFQVGFFGDWLRSWDEFDLELERLKVIAQPTMPVPPPDGRGSLPASIVEEGVCIDLGTQRIYVDGREIEKPLTGLAYRMLIYLAERVDQVVSREEIGRHTYQEEHYQGSEQALDQLASRIRKALKDRAPHKYLQAVPKQGFRLRQATIVRTSSNNAEGQST